MDKAIFTFATKIALIIGFHPVCCGAGIPTLSSD